MIGSKGRRKPYKDKIRNLLVNRTSPVLVSSEREGSGIDSRVCTILGHFRKPAFALLTRIPQATPTNLSTEAGNPSALVIMVRRGAPADESYLVWAEAVFILESLPRLQSLG